MVAMPSAWPATMWPPMMAHDGLAAPLDVQTAEQVGRAIGDELRARLVVDRLRLHLVEFRDRAGGVA